MNAVALKVQEEAVVEAVEEIVVEEDFDELEAMFEELESGLTEEEMEAADAVVGIELAKQEALAEMDEAGEAVSDEAGIAVGAEAAIKPTKAAVVKEPKVKATKRISTAGSKTSEALTASMGAKLADYMTFEVKDGDLHTDDLETLIKVRLDEMDTLPIKIQEKAVNFFANVTKGATLSNYSKIAIDLLVKNGSITSKELRDAYIARPYSVGTANSQCTQLLKLMQVLKLVVKDGAVLKANPDSTLLPLFAAE